MAHRGRHRFLFAAAMVLVAVAAGYRSSSAAPTPGFVENWAGTGLGGWRGGAGYDNPGTGGTAGAGDGFLRISTASPGNLASYSDAAAYAGDWIAAGIVGVRLWLKDVDASQALEIHFAIGSRQEFWLYNEAFVPLSNQWKEFVVDLTSSDGWTQIIGSGTFQDALRNANRIHLRHDLAPFTQNPDNIAGEFGVDQLLLTDMTVDVRPTSWGRIKALYR